MRLSVVGLEWGSIASWSARAKAIAPPAPVTATETTRPPSGPSDKSRRPKGAPALRHRSDPAAARAPVDRPDKHGAAPPLISSHLQSPLATVSQERSGEADRDVGSFPIRPRLGRRAASAGAPAQGRGSGTARPGVLRGAVGQAFGRFSPAEHLSVRFLRPETAAQEAGTGQRSPRTSANSTLARSADRPEPFAIRPFGVRPRGLRTCPAQDAPPSRCDRPHPVGLARPKSDRDLAEDARRPPATPPSCAAQVMAEARSAPPSAPSRRTAPRLSAPSGPRATPSSAPWRANSTPAPSAPDAAAVGTSRPSGTCACG